MVARRPKYPPRRPPIGVAMAWPRVAWLAAACSLVSTASADGWSGSVGIANDKVYRGLSQTGGRPSALLDLAYRTDTGHVAGLGLASLRDEDGSTLAEVTLSAGHAWQLGGDWTPSVGLVHYAYPGGLQRVYADYDEVSATLGWRGRLFGMVALSPNTVGIDAAGERTRGRVLTTELNWQQALVGRFTFDAGIGQVDQQAIGGSYRYGSAGLGWADGPAAAYLSYIVGRDVPGAPAVGGRRWVAALLWSF